MSLLENNLKSVSNSDLVEKILEQGQRLRNSMVQAVLNNDPFNTEILYTNSPRKNIDTGRYTTDSIVDIKKTYDKNEIMRVQRYLHGEEMCMNEEIKALETLRSMSPTSLIHSTSCVKNTCHYKDSCDICNEYESRMLVGSVPSVSSNKVERIDKNINYYTLLNKKDIENRRTEAKKKLQETETTSYENVQNDSSVKLKAVKETFHDNRKLLKYVDSLKINVYSLKLNSAGNRKILSAENINKSYLSSSISYFIEYSLPDILTQSIQKSRAKVNSGLNPEKVTKFFSRKTQNESIYFKQHSVHQISNISMLDLSNLGVEFKISYRSIKQKTPLLIGKATFNIGYLLTTQFFTGEQELVLKSDKSPITLGSLKVSVQFGCDKLYFGKEFIDAISCCKENTNLSETDSIHKLSDNESKSRKKVEKVLVTTNKNVDQSTTKEIPNLSTNKTYFEQDLGSKTENETAKADDESPLLYALIYISEVRLLTKSLNSYIVCRGFTRDDTITSKTVYNDFKPNFNLYQIIPVLLDEDFINRLRDNYITIEVWEQTENTSEKLIGISKLPLHQLYVAYRNPTIVKHLSKNPYPVVGVDWWEPVTCPISSTETGQLRAIVALGSSTQLDKLEQTRHLKKSLDQVSSKFKPTDNTEDHLKLHSSSSVLSDYHAQNKLPTVVQFNIPEKRNQVKISNYDGITSFRKYSPERINKNSFLKEFERFPSLEKTYNSTCFPQQERNYRTTNLDTIVDERNFYNRSDKTTNPNKISSYENVNSFTDVNTKKTVLVSDKYVQEPEIEITPSIISVDKVVETTNSSKVDASTQSDINMDSDKDNKISTTNNAQFTQRDFLNSFLEQLLTARDSNQKNKQVENSTNTENLNPKNTSHVVSPIVDNKKSSTVSSASLIDTNMNKSNTTTFPQNSITNNQTNVENVSVRNTSDLLDSLQKALSFGNKNEHNISNLDISNNEKDNDDSFKAHIVIENALHLPSRKKCKSKRNKTKSLKNNEEILPSSYVTFKDCSENDYMITSVVPKSTSPRWDYRCDVQLPSDLLLNNQKRLIFKVWRKANGSSLQPNFQTDIVLGFAALDLTVLMSGLPNVQGWFNIMDFSSKCNGQIKISVTPLENLLKYNDYKRVVVPEKLRVETTSVNLPSVTERESELEQETTEDSVPSELLSRALKRKFTELDEITQRLRQRLSAVTNDDSDLSNDDFVDEFERDLNTICVETEPFIFPEEKMTINVEDNSVEIATSSKVNSTSDLFSLNFVQPLIDLSSKQSENGSSTTSEINVPTVQENLTKLDTHLTEGKLKIDKLLEKLSLLTGDNDNPNKSDRSFSSRYVSGCSINHEPESSNTNQVLKDIGVNKPENIDPDLIFNPQLFQQMFTASLDSTPRLDSLEFMSSVHCTTLNNLVQDSSSSGSSRDLQSGSSTSISDTNLTRQAPDGAGNISNN